jgi:phage shock protein A
MDDVDREGGTESAASLPRAERRRFGRFGDPTPVATLVDQSLRSAELQLLEAREALKDARRRVVQLEDALEGWKRLREQMVRTVADAARAASN